MLSRECLEVDQATGEKSLYPPHVMIYAPYRTNAELGFTKEQIGSTEHPWILQEGTPSAYIIIVTKK